jgi:hypothetical protein
MSSNSELNFAVKSKSSTNQLERKSLKEIVSLDILAASIQSLELSQVNYLLRKEISTMHPSSARSFVGSQPNAFELSTKMIRLCLYYETAINLACSIIDKSASIARKILLFDDDPQSSSLITDSGWFEAQIASKELSQFDPVVAKFVAHNIPGFERLFSEKRNQLYETSSIVNSIDLSNPDKAAIQLYATAIETKKEIDSATDLIQDFLKFMDNYLKSKLELK